MLFPVFLVHAFFIKHAIGVTFNGFVIMVNINIKIISLALACMSESFVFACSKIVRSLWCSSSSRVQKIEVDDKCMYRVLIVDDQKINRKVLGYHLKKYFGEVIEVQSGEEALECLSNDMNPIEIIFMDFEMNNLMMNGAETINMIRNRTNIKRPYIIAYSSETSYNDEMMKIGADIKLNKNEMISIEEIRGIISGYKKCSEIVQDNTSTSSNNSTGSTESGTILQLPVSLKLGL